MQYTSAHKTLSAHEAHAQYHILHTYTMALPTKTICWARKYMHRSTIHQPTKHCKLVCCALWCMHTLPCTVTLPSKIPYVNSTNIHAQMHYASPSKALYASVFAVLRACTALGLMVAIIHALDAPLVKYFLNTNVSLFPRKFTCLHEIHVRMSAVPVCDAEI